jgi:2-C-methyl-D-erythritol 4-phosphate cytidylyltransferase
LTARSRQRPSPTRPRNATPRGSSCGRSTGRRLWAVQTPQVFRREALERALARPAEELAKATDEASLIEQAGGSVRVVPAPPENLKVTTPLDLLVAEQLLRRRVD